MRIALVHDWLVTYGGAERVLEEVLRLYPTADVFSTIDALPPTQRSFLGGRVPRTSFLQRLPLRRRLYRYFLPLMPAAIESLDVSGYDLVISLSFAVAKGLITHPDQLHLCYLQARNLHYAYEERVHYAGGGLRGLAEELLLPRIRVWDSVASRRPDVTFANSEYVRRWHRHRHGIDAPVIYPPVDIRRFAEERGRPRDGYFVTVGRLEPFKRMDLVVRAFSALGLPLLVVGHGTQAGRLRRLASANVRFLGYQPAAEVARVVARAQAFVFASREHFGVAPIEAQACGTPVIGYRGGALGETIRDLHQEAPTGVLFDQPTAEALTQAVRRFQQDGEHIRPADCYANAQRFSAERFRREFVARVESACESHQAARPAPLRPDP